MNKSLRWKILAIFGVVALCVWTVYPPAEKVRLGLDLKGGVHLVLRVQTDDALRLETETAMERLREELVKGGVANVAATALAVDAFQISGVPPNQDALVRQAATEIEATYNRESGAGGSYTFRMKPNIAEPAAPGDCGAGTAHDRAARERAWRGRADRGADRAVRIRSWCSCPVSAT